MDTNLTPQQEAKSLTTRPERLRELANDINTDWSILRVIASNPNTPKDILLHLGLYFPKEFMNNPVLEILLLENPYLITEMSCNMVITLLKLDPMLKFWSIETIVKHPGWIEIFENIEIPIHLLKNLACHVDYKVRSLAAKHSNTSVNILIMLATDEKSFVRKLVASNKNTPRYIINILSNDEEYVRRGVAANPNTPQYVIESYSTGNKYERALIASNPSTPLNILEILSQDTIFDVRASVAKNNNAPASILKVLFQNCEDIFKCFLEEKNYLNLIDKLQKFNFQSLGSHNIYDLWQKYFGFRLAFASNPNTPANILEILATDNSYDDYDALEIRREVAKNLNTGVNALKILSQDANIIVRSNVALNPNTPVDILEILSRDETFIRMSVACNPNTPNNILETLSHATEVSIFCKYKMNVY